MGLVIIAIVIIAIAAFLVGFLLGVSNEPVIKPIKIKVQDDKDLQLLKKEYQNFLSYDGSEQE